MTPDKYRQKYKRCSTCEYYDKSCFECKVQKKFIYNKEKLRPFCKTYKAMPFSR